MEKRGYQKIEVREKRSGMKEEKRKETTRALPLEHLLFEG